MSLNGQVYLICFDKHYHHAKHYIGFTDAGVEQRLEKHRLGVGAKLLRAVSKADIEFDVVRIWEDVDRHFERKLKNRKNAKRLCPRCKEEIMNEKGMKEIEEQKQRIRDKFSTLDMLSMYGVTYGFGAAELAEDLNDMLEDIDIGNDLDNLELEINRCNLDKYAEEILKDD